ncbi:alpha/beta fold hydrolase [Streptomyces sp. NBC_00258]|uniref:alpha/beta fold hydrolase n=1 Tax=Streptomyces sp. NBC_00258 TaxID=2903642 RepID=UPI002E2AE5B7|nr:alpha/beta hydrolase [Streptomyces sp. NBC_00258]
MDTDTATVSTRDGCTLTYRDTGGEGIPLVLLHGWSQSQAMYDRLLPLLPVHQRVITYDMRNHGTSGRTDNGARVATLAADLHQLLAHLDVDRAHLLGHSMGASVLWSYFELFGSEQIRSLVIVDQPTACTILPWLEASEAARFGAILDYNGAAAFARAMLSQDSEATRLDFLTSMLTKDIPPQDLDWLYQENLLLPMPWGARLLLDHIMQDWRDVLPRIAVPTLVIGGEASHVAPASQAWTAAHIPNAELRVLTRGEGGAHFAFFESPQDFANVLEDFLKRL